MLDWLPNFLSGLDKEAAVVLGSGLGAAVVAIFAASRGIKKGRPTPAAVHGVASAMAKNSCGAPELVDMVRSIMIQNEKALFQQDYIVKDIETMKTHVAIIHDRLRGS